jgi:hypothetical protein
VYRIDEIFLEDEYVSPRILLILCQPNIEAFFDKLAHFLQVISVKGSAKLLEFVDIDQNIQFIYCFLLELLQSG